jgi:hypothetical protein
MAKTPRPRNFQTFRLYLAAVLSELSDIHKVPSDLIAEVANVEHEGEGVALLLEQGYQNLLESADPELGDQWGDRVHDILITAILEGWNVPTNYPPRHHEPMSMDLVTDLCGDVNQIVDSRWE